MIVLFIWVACGFVAAMIASGKGHSFFLWLILGVIFGFFAVIVAACLPKH